MKGGVPLNMRMSSRQENAVNQSCSHRVGALAGVLLAATILLAWAFCGTAAADYPIKVDVSPASAAGPAPASQTRTTGTLSRTGSDSVRYAAVAVALVVTGSMVVLVTRRRGADSTA
jgi:hypothetical protein